MGGGNFRKSEVNLILLEEKVKYGRLRTKFRKIKQSGHGQNKFILVLR